MSGQTLPHLETSNLVLSAMRMRNTLSRIQEMKAGAQVEPDPLTKITELINSTSSNERIGTIPKAKNSARISKDARFMKTLPRPKGNLPILTTEADAFIK